MILKFFLVTLVTPQLVYSSPQFGFINTLASQALGLGESIVSDFIPNTQGPQSLPTPSNAPPVVTSAQPTPSPPQPPTSSVSSTSLVLSTSSAPTSSSTFTSTTATSLSSSSTSLPTFSSHHGTTSPTSSKTSSQSPITAAATKSPDTAGSHPSHPNTIAVAIGVICAVLVIFAILGVIWSFIRRRNRKLYSNFESQQNQTYSAGSSFVQDDEKPLAKYDGPCSSRAVFEKPLPVLVDQHVYLPYRPPHRESHPSTKVKIEYFSRAPQGIPVSEIDGKPVERAPVELEGSIPVARIETGSSSQSSDVESRVQESKKDECSDPANVPTIRTAESTNVSTKTKDHEKKFEIARKPMTGTNP